MSRSEQLSFLADFSLKTYDHFKFFYGLLKFYYGHFKFFLS